MKSIIKISMAALGSLSLVFSLGACSSGSASNQANAAGPTNETVTVNGISSFATEPMYYYKTGNEPAGMLIDLIEAAAKQSHIKISWQKVPYSGLIPALQSGRADVVGAQFSRTPATAGVVNLLAIYKASASILVPSGVKYADVTDTCGIRLGFVTGSSFDKDTADGMQAECTKAGKTPIQYETFPSFAAGETALRSGRVDAYLTSTPQVLLAAKKVPGLEAALVGKLALRYSGFALSKAKPELTNKLTKGFDAIIKSGEYKKILDSYGLANQAIDKVYLNDQVPSVVPSS
ncbi:transporter substrate-binding domain-containing protein [Arthrobacter sp. STN4]|uniref:transporter substrate-binding domain-containing protein n=1 Tax=Arthrobacter sp. STN4 TaxID=2923276 RepID=UPI002119EBEC|nr:transporter substrate-binding domain-containing protein [Arthrobacter sp. STN4]MCQ9163741.1 transporter substrate-binding domain-containing protein [Arthrobacter sp. STN4]